MQNEQSKRGTHAGLQSWSKELANWGQYLWQVEYGALNVSLVRDIPDAKTLAPNNTDLGLFKMQTLDLDGFLDSANRLCLWSGLNQKPEQNTLEFAV